MLFTVTALEQATSIKVVDTDETMRLTIRTETANPFYPEFRRTPY